MSTDGKSAEGNIMPDFDIDQYEILDEPTIMEPPVEPEVKEEPKVETKVEDTSPEPKVESAPAPEVKTEDAPEETGDPIATGVYQAMVEKGYVNENPEFKGTYEELDEIFEKMPEAIWSSVVSQLPDPVRHLLEYGFNKPDASVDDLSSFFNNYVKTDNATIDINDADGQREFLKKDLMAKGVSEDEAEDLIDVWEDKGTLAEKAKTQFEKLQENKEKAREEAIAKAEEEKKQRQQQVKQFRDSIVSEIEKTEWKPQKKQQVINEIFQGELNRKSREIAKYPKALYQLADFMTYLNEETGEFDLDAFKTQALTPETQRVKNKLQSVFKDVKTNSATVKEKENKPKEIDLDRFEIV